MPPLLTVSSLSKSYGAVVALSDVDLQIGRGELVGLLGPNGAGKSTLVKICCGLTRATEGRAEVDGFPAASRDARRRIGYLAELFRFPAWLTADELLELHQGLVRSSGGGAERSKLLEIAGLQYARDRKVGEMSKGMQQRLGLAQALIGEPPLLLLDEPTSALDPSGRHVVRALLADLKSRGVSVLLNSHLLGEVEKVCDRCVILSHGRVVAEGTPEVLTKASGVEVRTGTGWQRWPDVAETEIPSLVSDLVAAGENIYEVRSLQRSLEEVYLAAVDGHEVGESQ